MSDQTDRDIIPLTRASVRRLARDRYLLRGMTAEDAEERAKQFAAKMIHVGVLPEVPSFPDIAAINRGIVKDG